MPIAHALPERHGLTCIIFLILSLRWQLRKHRRIQQNTSLHRIRCIPSID